HAAFHVVLQTLHALFELDDALADVAAHARQVFAKQQHAQNDEHHDFHGAQAEDGKQRMHGFLFCESLWGNLVHAIAGGPGGLCLSRSSISFPRYRPIWGRFLPNSEIPRATSTTISIGPSPKISPSIIGASGNRPHLVYQQKKGWINKNARRRPIRRAGRRVFSSIGSGEGVKQEFARYKNVSNSGLISKLLGRR